MAAEEVAVDVGVDGFEEEEVVVRGRYNMVTDVDRRRLVNAFQSNQDWLTLASNLNIKRQTARNIILKFRRTGVTDAARKDGNRPKKIDDEMVAYLIRRV